MQISGVIGSAVFNIMFVISVCGLCTTTVSKLNWWPLCRDCFFYAVSILVMLGTIYNESISWWENFNIFIKIYFFFYIVVISCTKFSLSGWNPCSCWLCTVCIAWRCLSTLDWNDGRNLTIYLFYQKTTNPRKKALSLVTDRCKRIVCRTQGLVLLRISIKHTKVIDRHTSIWMFDLVL